MANKTHYALYLESGPRQRKTMVHVLELLGCIAQGPTTEAALEATPAAIRAYLSFLQRHGAAVDPISASSVEPAAPFTTSVAQHVMEGPWLGNGDPVPGFAPDFQPLTAKDQHVYIRRLTWLRGDLLDLVRDLPREQLVAEPERRGRSIARIVEHVAESHAVYLRDLVGKVEGLTEALQAVQQGPQDVANALTRLWYVSTVRLEALSEAERAQQIVHGQVTWTARRALRRMLEHEWEHLLEIAERLGRPLA